jgi:hypothetical protein
MPRKGIKMSCRGNLGEMGRFLELVDEAFKDFILFRKEVMLTAR